MAEQLPETPFERASKDERDKERLERQKILVSLPKGKPEQAILTLLAEKTAEAHEELEDVLLLLATEDLNTVKARLVQHLRGLCAKTARMFMVEQVAAKEGTAVAKQVFIPPPAYMGLDEEEKKIWTSSERRRRRLNCPGRCSTPRSCPTATATTTASFWATKKNSAASLYAHR